jgi:hypothetical protein
MIHSCVLVSLFIAMVNACTIHEFRQNSPEFTKVSVIQKLYFDKYPGTNLALNALSEKPDTTTFYESEKISFYISTAPFNDIDEKVRYDLRNIYFFDKVEKRLFLIPNSSESVIEKLDGENLWQKLKAKSSLNISKMEGIAEEVYQDDLNKLSIIFTKESNDETEGLQLDSLNIYFDPHIHDDQYSISRYYDTLGYGKVLHIEFKVAAFYSKLLQRQVEAFDFYDRIIFHGKVNNSPEIEFLNRIQAKVEEYKRSKTKSEN